MWAICIHKFLHMSCRANPRRLNNHHHALNLVTSLDFAHVSPMRALPNSLGNGNNGCRKMHVSLRVLSVILHLCTDPIFSVLVHYLQKYREFRAFLWVYILTRFSLWAVVCEGLNRLIKILPSVCTLPVYGYDPFVLKISFYWHVGDHLDFYLFIERGNILWLNLCSIRSLLLVKTRLKRYEICDRTHSYINVTRINNICSNRHKILFDCFKRL